MIGPVLIASALFCCLLVPTCVWGQEAGKEAAPPVAPAPAPAPPAPSAKPEPSKPESPPVPPPAAIPAAPATGTDYYKNYFSKGTIRIGGGTDLAGNITQFNITHLETDQASVSLSGGYFLRNNWEMGAAASYSYTRQTTTTTDQNSSAYSFLVGPSYYFPVDGIAVPFVGGRLGWGKSNTPTQNKDGFTIQVQSGLDFLISPSWSIDLQALYQHRFGGFNEDHFSATLGFSIYWR